MARPNARNLLLDAAERLFAEHGIPTVSDRQIADAAGNTNHSAVSYYFGGRRGLIEALLERHQAGIEPRRRAMFEESDSLLGDIRSVVIPLTSALAELPTPSWRARFLDQALHDPPTAELLRSGPLGNPMAGAVARSVVQRLAHLDANIVRARAQLTAEIISTACARIEELAEQSGQPARWAEAGTFLCDALAGLLQAPITSDMAPGDSSPDV